VLIFRSLTSLHLHRFPKTTSNVTLLRTTGSRWNCWMTSWARTITQLMIASAYATPWAPVYD